MVGEITAYSIISAVLFFDLGLIFVGVLRKNTIFLVKSSTGVLELLFVLSIVRLLIPWDNPYAKVIGSERIYPFIQDEILFRQSILGLNVGQILLAIWGIGSGVSLFYLAYGMMQEIRQIKSYKTVENEDVKKIADDYLGNSVIVRISPDIDVPQVYGIRKAHIFLPPIKLSKEELKFVLKHEYYHVKGKDMVIKLFYESIMIIFWWNPLTYYFRNELENLLEIRCDNSVAKNMNDTEKLSYLKVILDVAKHAKDNCFVKRKNISTLVNTHCQGIVQQRFEIVLNKKKDYALRKMFSYGTVILLFILSYFVIVQPRYSIEFEHEVEVNTENSYLWDNGDGTYDMYVDGEMFEQIEEKDLSTPPYDRLEIKKLEKKQEQETRKAIDSYIIIENGKELRVYKNGAYLKNIAQEELGKPPFNNAEIVKGKN